MTLLTELLAWFSEPAHWQGSDGIPTRVAEHLYFVAISVLLGALVALPLGIGLGHWRRGGLLAINLANVGRAIPSLGLVVMMFFLVGYGDLPALIALVALAIPPIVTNAYTGMIEVDARVRQAAIALGMTSRQRLWQVEVPLAIPMIMAGVRTSVVQVMATATLAAYVGLGGLGRYLIDGLGQRDTLKVLAGALIVALMAMLTELALAGIQRALSPRVATARERPEGEADAEDSSMTRLPTGRADDDGDQEWSGGLGSGGAGDDAGRLFGRRGAPRRS